MQRLKAELEKFADLSRRAAGRSGHGGCRHRTAPKTHVLSGGLRCAAAGGAARFLTILDPVAREDRATTARIPPARAALANWLTDPENPLTARVMVNRIWHYHFGRGIVGRPSDFGKMGERPRIRNCWTGWRGVCAAWLEHEGDASADADVEDVPAVGQLQ